MSEIVFLLEEQSTAVLLEGFLPKLHSGEVTHRFIVFEGKQDLEKQMVRRIRGYRVRNAKFVVLRDQDAGDCKMVKRQLVKKCAEAGQSGALVRVACHELESWYLADLRAVENALNLRNLARHQNKRQYRSPDSYHNPLQTLRRIAPGYQKVGGSRSIGPHLDPACTRSRSFSAFVSGIRRLLETIPSTT